VAPARQEVLLDPPSELPLVSPSSCLIYGALAGVAVSNAGYNILTKHAITNAHKADALIFSLCRDVAAYPVLQAGAFLIDGVQRPQTKDIPLIVVLGLLGMFCNQYLFIYGMAGDVSATEASVLSQLQPIFAAMFAIIAKQVGPSWMLFAGVVLTFAGSVVMAEVWTVKSIAGSQSIHLLSVVGSAFCMALYYVAQKPILNRYPPLSLTAWSYLFGALWMMLASCGYLTLPKTELHAKWASMNTSVNLLTLVFAVLMNSVLKYALQSFSNKWTGATTLTAWSCLTPILTGFVGAVVPAFHENLSWAYLGSVPVLIGVYLVTLAREREKAAAAAALKGAADEGSSA